MAAAYRVQLPDGAAPWVRIVGGASCDAPDDPPRNVADLGKIRRVGDETHFFARHVEVAGVFMDVDTQTAVAYVAVSDAGDPRRSVVGNLAVVMVPGDETLPPGQGDGGGAGGGSGSYPPAGPWLACGVFVLP